ncbi:hypothetical protein [Ruegeria sp. HKCCD7255]|uniref:hypothetical protein n=1 Tax=Ruegeria sp. HKCCD7255 TaxID=2683004 RepID=UPI001487C1BA|nr:hypothetical protein [Ruegeria sp. HKCCD7255]
MIWNTKTHQFSATLCQRTGKPCPALAQLARAIAQAMSTAKPVTTDGFEVDGHAQLTHCAKGCTARYLARPKQVRIFCDADPRTENETLEQFADLMFSCKVTSMPADALVKAPCAMLQVTTNAAPVAVQAAEQASI